MIRLRIMYVLLSIGLIVFGAMGVFQALRYRSAQSIAYSSFAQQKPAGWFKITGAGYDLTEAAPYEKDKTIEALYVPLRAANELGRNEATSPVRTFLVIRPNRNRATIDFYKEMRQVLDGQNPKTIINFLYKNKARIYHKGTVSGMMSQTIDLESDLAKESELRREFPLMVSDVAFLENEKSPTLAGPLAMLAAGLFLSALGIRSVRSKIGKDKAPNGALPTNVSTGASTSAATPVSPFPTTPTSPPTSSSSPPNSPWN